MDLSQGTARLQDRDAHESARLTQVEAAALFGVRQPDVSKMLRGESRQFSVERLLRRRELRRRPGYTDWP